jgi:hypothetical protein
MSSNQKIMSERIKPSEEEMVLFFLVSLYSRPNQIPKCAVRNVITS